MKNFKIFSIIWIVWNIFFLGFDAYFFIENIYKNDLMSIFWFILVVVMGCLTYYSITEFKQFKKDGLI